MQSALDRHFTEVLLSASLKEYSQHVVDFAHRVGMRTFGSTVITDHSPTLTEFQYISNAAPDYRSEYEDLESAKIDPVSQHGKRSSTPLVWDQSTYTDSGTGSLWEHQAQFGYCSGISIALHLPRGRHFLFGIDCEKASSCKGRDVKRVVEDVYLFASHAQAAAFDLCAPYRPPADNDWEMSSLELEPLRWSMDGLTNWEIGKKLGLSERDVERRLLQSSKRLGCATKYETMLRAIKLGLIECA